jgi:hypothetical protein
MRRRGLQRLTGRVISRVSELRFARQFLARSIAPSLSSFATDRIFVFTVCADLSRPVRRSFFGVLIGYQVKFLHRGELLFVNFEVFSPVTENLEHWAGPCSRRARAAWAWPSRRAWYCSSVEFESSLTQNPADLRTLVRRSSYGKVNCPDLHFRCSGTSP